MNKVCLFMGLMLGLLFASCREEFNDHFDSEATVGEECRSDTSG